jgi:hypothetical protein
MVGIETPTWSIISDTARVSGVAAAVSVGFAVWSRWQATRSKAARAKAEAAATTAEAAAENAERQRAAVERIAKSVAGPPFVIKHVNRQSFTLRNNTEEPVSGVRVANRGEFFKLDLGETFDLDAWQTVKFLAAGAAHSPRPPELVIVLPDQRQVRVAFPAGAPNSGGGLLW